MAQGKNGKSANKSGKKERKREGQGEETEQTTRKWNANKMWKPSPNSYPRKSNLKLTVDGWHLFAACLVSIFHLLAQSICLLIFLLVFDLPCRLLIFDWIRVPREYSLDSRAVAHKPWLHLAAVLSPSPSLSLRTDVHSPDQNWINENIIFPFYGLTNIIPPSPIPLASISVCSILFFSGTCLRERNPHREFSFSFLFHFFGFKFYASHVFWLPLFLSVYLPVSVSSVFAILFMSIINISSPRF